jgi:predicted nucleic acid-binding protein
MYVLDTNILIYYSRQERKIVEAIDKELKVGELLAVSTITEGELLSWPELTAADQRIIEDILATVVIVPVDSLVARVAATFRREYRTELLDAMIAATAFLRSVPLMTRNSRDFSRIKEIEVVSF